MKCSIGSSSRRGRVALPLGIATLVGLPLFIAGGSPSVSAVTPNLPVFPNNLVVFPNRDFVTIEGFAEYGGQFGKVEVTRPGVGVVGSAVGEMSGGDVAFEINHPGGVCWGEGTGLNVTPDIQAGDVVSLIINDEVVAATTTLDVAADDATQPAPNMVVVTGRIGDGVIPAQMEQRIIEPALVDTSIARRDVRALPGPMIRSDKGGYSSELLFDEDANTFKATYVFDIESEAFIAAHAGLGERAMAWEFVDEAANRQGLTIAENGEPGGPGMGGCPNGPLQSGPPGPEDGRGRRHRRYQGQLVTGCGDSGNPCDPRLSGDGGLQVADQRRIHRDRSPHHEPECQQHHADRDHIGGLRRQRRVAQQHR